MPDYTDPAHYSDAATAAEQQMRADFSHVLILRARAGYTDKLTESDQLLALATEIEQRWKLRDGSLPSDWVFLMAACATHQGPRTLVTEKDLTARAIVAPPAVDDDAVLPIHRRSRRQAAELIAWIDQLPKSA